MVVSFLRGINIGSINQLKMSDVTNMYTRLGYFKIATYLNTGNIVFIPMRNRSTKLIEQEIKNIIKHCSGLDIEVIVRTKEELKRMLDDCPFDNKNIKHKYVTMLKNESYSYIANSVEEAKRENDEYHITSKDIYLYLPNGYGKSKLNNGFFEDKTGKIATTRSLSTLTKVYELMN